MSTNDLKRRHEFRPHCSPSTKMSHRLLEYQVQTLVELYCVVRTDDVASAVVEAVKKLRFMSYVDDGDAGMKNSFLELLVDEFIDVIPEHLVEIYEQLGAVTLPPDLAQFADSLGGDKLESDPLDKFLSLSPPAVPEDTSFPSVADKRTTAQRHFHYSALSPTDKEDSVNQAKCRREFSPSLLLRASEFDRSSGLLLQVSTPSTSLPGDMTARRRGSLLTSHSISMDQI